MTPKNLTEVVVALARLEEQLKSAFKRIEVLEKRGISGGSNGRGLRAAVRDNWLRTVERGILAGLIVQAIVGG